MATIKMEGQEFPLDDEIAGSDEDLKAALKPLYPEIGNATIQRTNKEGEMVVTIVKQAGRKGVQSLQGSLGLLEELERADGAEVLDLALALVRTDGGTQTRQATNYDVAREYAEAMQAGAQFPAVKVIYDGTDYWLFDGFHTTAAHHIAERETIRAIVRPGTRRDAVLAAVGANQSHGLRRTNDDKRRAVTILLQDEEWGQWSDREIGERAGVSHTFVGNIRRELTPSANALQTQERVAQRGGTTYTFSPATTPDTLRAAGQQEFTPPEAALEMIDDGTYPGDGTNEGPEFAANDFPDQLAEETAAAHDEGVVKSPTVAPSTPPEGTKPESPAPIPARPAPAPVAPPTPVAPAAKPLPFDQSEITVTLVLRPDDGKDGGRRVLMTAQVVGCQPVVKVLRLSQFWPWQPQIEDVLQAFRQQLPDPGKPADASVGLAGSPAGEPVDRDAEEAEEVAE